MSITDTFDVESVEIVKPEHIISKTEGFPEVVVAVFQQSIIEVLTAKYAPSVITHVDPGYHAPVYKLRYKGKDIAVYRTLIGGAGAAGLLEEMIALGGRKFVYFGACGTLDSDIAAGHYIIPTEAYRDEGTSYHYCPAGDYIAIQTADKLAGIFNEMGLPYRRCRTWTTDALYRETKGNMLKRRADGCRVVEMECASLMAVGQFRNVEVYQYLYGEDTLDGAQWDARTMGRIAEDTYEKYLGIALEIAVRI